MRAEETEGDVENYAVNEVERGREGKKKKQNSSFAVDGEECGRKFPLSIKRANDAEVSQPWRKELHGLGGRPVCSPRRSLLQIIYSRGSFYLAYTRFTVFTRTLRYKLYRI